MRHGDKVMSTTTETTMSVEEYDKLNLAHIGCVIAKYNLSDEEWDATPERLQQELLKECAATDNNTPAPATAQTCVDCGHALTDFSGYACNICKHRCKSWTAPIATPTQGEHTPLPWRGERINGAILLKDAEDHSIAEVWSSFIDSIDDANAAFIVKAVNNHAKLVAALRGLMNEYGHVEGCDRKTPPHAERPCRRTCEAARAALADAQQ